LEDLLPRHVIDGRREVDEYLQSIRASNAVDGDDSLGRQRLSTYLATAPIALPRNGDVLTSKAHTVELQQDARQRTARHAAGRQHCANRALDRSRLAPVDDVDPSLDHRPLAGSNTPS